MPEPAGQRGMRPSATAPPPLPAAAALWQGGAVKHAALLLPLFLLAAAACAPEGHERLTAGERTYGIPSDHISTLTREPHTFVRIKHPERPYDLVFDSRTQGATDARGAPVIFSINDGKSPGIQYFRSGVGIVTCRRAVNPRGGCGIKLSHGRNEWSLIFPEKRVGEAESFVRDAAALLDRYQAAAP